jgi:hemolysin D
MNQRITPPAASEKSAPPGKADKAAKDAASSPVKGPDREFLPAALEILETPPAPLPVFLMLTICGFFAAALAWSFVGRLDIHAVAPGKIETAGRAKVVQPLDPGKIAVIAVANGAHVRAGDPLFELDPAEAAADDAAAHDSLSAGLAEVARRRYAIDTVGALIDPAASNDPATDRLPDALSRAAIAAKTKISWTEFVPDAFRLREHAVLTADFNQLGSAIKNIDTQMAGKQATLQRLNMSIAYQDTLIETLKQRVNTRQEAIDLKVGTKINLYDAKQELEKSQSELASDQGQIIETNAALTELASEKTKALSAFMADNENKLADAARKVDEAWQGLAKAAAKLSHTKLAAPIDGVVQQLAVTTIGQVVTTGQQLAVITPSDGPLQVQALVANLDIGFIKVGQDAAIKVDAFPFTRYGTIHGKVIDIDAEAVEEQTAKRSLADATSSANGASAPSSAPGQPETFVFPVTIALDQSAMKIDSRMIALTPGMTVSAEIKTDSRPVIDYLLSPLARAASESMRER